MCFPYYFCASFFTNSFNDWITNYLVILLNAYIISILFDNYDSDKCIFYEMNTDCRKNQLFCQSA